MSGMNWWLIILYYRDGHICAELYLSTPSSTPSLSVLSHHTAQCHCKYFSTLFALNFVCTLDPIIKILKEGTLEDVKS